MRHSAADRGLIELQLAVERRIGLAPTWVSEHDLRRAVLEFKSETAASSEHDCVHRILTDSAQFESLIDQLVVPETWFFRDRQPFHFLRGYATQSWRPLDVGQPLRVLSLPCGSGEEPYSIAMTLLGAGLTPTQFEVDAADVSKRLLARAIEGTYPLNSLRGDEREFADSWKPYLEPHASGVAASAPLRALVRYFQANLVSPDLLVEGPKYDLVFCRNLLIYLGEDARRAALANLHRLLLPNGVLYAGHVEARTVAEGPFERLSDQFPSAFRPVDSEAAADHHAAVQRKPFAPAKLSRAGRKHDATVKPRSQRSSKPAPPTAAPPTTHIGLSLAPANSGSTGDMTRSRSVNDATVDVARLLACARSAADAGHIDQAQRMCREALLAEPANAEAFYLLGLAAGASGRPRQAEAHYRRALYLDPSHAESLIHMGLLAKQRGDQQTSDNYLRRARHVGRREERR